MSEFFVKTFKRDYVRCNPCPDAVTVLAHLDRWFEDYMSLARFPGHTYSVGEEPAARYNGKATPFLQ